MLTKAGAFGLVFLDSCPLADSDARLIDRQSVNNQVAMVVYLHSWYEGSATTTDLMLLVTNTHSSGNSQENGASRVTYAGS